MLVALVEIHSDYGVGDNRTESFKKGLTHGNILMKPFDEIFGDKASTKK